MDRGYTSYKMRLRPEILAEAGRCFSRYGIRAVKMDDMARNLGISKRTVYELYATKEELLCEVIRSRNESRIRQIKTLVENSDNAMDLLVGVLGMQVEMIATVNVEFFKDLPRFPKAARAASEFHDRLGAHADEFFARGVEEGFFLAEVDYTVFNKIVSGTMEMLHLDSRYDDFTYRDLFVGYLYVMIRGICTNKGQIRIDDFVKRHF